MISRICSAVRYIIFNRVRLADLKELRGDIIQSVWAVEERRELSRAEILKMCAGKIK
jgi:hypothetical protein